MAVGMAVCALLQASTAAAQIRTGGIHGVVEDPTGARVAGQDVEVADPSTGQRWRVATDAQGTFVLAPLPYGRYRLRVFPAAGFRVVDVDAVVRSNLPTILDVRLALAALDDAQVVRAPFDTVPVTTRSEQRVNAAMAVLPAQRSASLASLISSGTGMARGHNALVHVRGVEDGLLYVVDGVPVTERYDLLHASAFDIDAVDAITVITGNLPAEFGGRSGAVVSIDRSSGQRASGYARIGGGSRSTVDASAGGGVQLRSRSICRARRRRPRLTGSSIRWTKATSTITASATSAAYMACGACRRRARSLLARLAPGQTRCAQRRRAAAGRPAAGAGARRRELLGGVAADALAPHRRGHGGLPSTVRQPALRQRVGRPHRRRAPTARIPGQGRSDR